MEPNQIDAFWDGCPLTGRDPGMVHGAPVMKNENGELTRLPVDTHGGGERSRPLSLE